MASRNAKIALKIAEINRQAANLRLMAAIFETPWFQKLMADIMVEKDASKRKK